MLRRCSCSLESKKSRPVYRLPELVWDHFNRQKRVREANQKFTVCVYGYSSLAKDILDSLQNDTRLKVILVTRSVIE